MAETKLPSMEVPKASIYDREKIRSIDFLDSALKVTFSLDMEAAQHLPEVTDAEIQTGQEKYHVLLGEYEEDGDNGVNVRIRGVLVADPSEQDLFYQEGKEKVVPNIRAIQQWVKAIRATVTEYRDFDFIGDIHTHPVTEQNELDAQTPAVTPSPEDVEDVIEEYESGTLSPDKPFIFGIAGRRANDEETGYAFYRLVRDGAGYRLDSLEKLNQAPVSTIRNQSSANSS